VAKRLDGGLGPGHIVLDGDPTPPPPKGLSPQFVADVCCGQMAGWIKLPLGMEVGLGPGQVVLDGSRHIVPFWGKIRNITLTGICMTAYNQSSQ